MSGKGSKIVFVDDEDDFEFPVAGPSSVTRSSPAEKATSREADSDDDDEAPETVGITTARAGVLSQEERIASLQKAKNKAAADRSRAVAAAKAKQKTPTQSRKDSGSTTPTTGRKQTGLKGAAKPARPPQTQHEDEDADTARLRRRMEAAMADGESEDEDSDLEASGSVESEVESGDEQAGLGESDFDDDDGASFHTESEEEGEDDDEEAGDESDDSETLQQGPLSDKERRMHARMQAMMEAAEKRAGLKPSKSQGKPKPAIPTRADSQELREEEDEEVDDDDNDEGTPIANAALEDDETQYDLQSYHPTAKPLSTKTLRAAVASEEARKKQEAQTKKEKLKRKAESEKGKTKKRKFEKEEDKVRQVSNNKHIQLLEPDITHSLTGLPPVVSALSSSTGTGNNSRSKFVKVAMKQSGLQPGRTILSGRRPLIGGLASKR